MELSHAQRVNSFCDLLTEAMAEVRVSRWERDPSTGVFQPTSLRHAQELVDDAMTLLVTMAQDEMFTHNPGLTVPEVLHTLIKGFPTPEEES